MIDLIQPHSINNTFIDNIVYHDNVNSFYKRFKKSVSFAVLNIDSYESTKFKLDALYEILSNQGIVVVTNYNEVTNGQPIDEFVYDFELELYKNYSVAYIIKNISDFEMPDDDDIDFGNLDAKIRELTRNRNRTAVANCTIPQASIVLTTSNYLMVPLLLLQHQAMKVNNKIQCLSNFFVTLCMDRKCYRECEAHNLLNCVYVRTKFALLPPSSFSYLENAYGYINYLKIAVHRAALRCVESFFFIEADVLIYKNPWDENVFVGRKADGTVIPNTSYDFMFQRERPRNKKYNDLSCENGLSLNGGQYYFLNSEPTRNFLDSLVANRNRTISLLGKGDQDFIVSAAIESNVRMCTLPANTITGHCRSMRALNHPISETITYHTACSSAANKASFMKDHIRCMIECPSSYYTNSNVEICNLSNCEDFSFSSIYYKSLLPTMFLCVMGLLYYKVVYLNVRKQLIKH